MKIILLCSIKWSRKENTKREIMRNKHRISLKEMDTKSEQDECNEREAWERWKNKKQLLRARPQPRREWRKQKLETWTRRANERANVQIRIEWDKKTTVKQSKTCLKSWRSTFILRFLLSVLSTVVFVCCSESMKLTFSNIHTHTHVHSAGVSQSVDGMRFFQFLVEIVLLYEKQHR